MVETDVTSRALKNSCRERSRCQPRKAHERAKSARTEKQSATNTIQNASGFFAFGLEGELAWSSVDVGEFWPVEAVWLSRDEATGRCSLAIEVGESSEAAEVIAGSVREQQRWERVQRASRA